MKNVKLLLRQNVKDLGTLGDIVHVRPGYARNYLLPYGLAVEATGDNMKTMERRRVRYEAELVAREAEIEKQIAAFSELQLVTREKADERGTLYGSVSAGAVAKLLAAAGQPVDERDVRLDEPIKVVGNHEVPIHIHGEHYASVQLLVEAAN